MSRLDEIKRELQSAGKQTASYFRSLPHDEWSVLVYADGNHWRVREMMAHFSTIEASMHRLFESVLEGIVAEPGEFDLDRYNLSQVAKIAYMDTDELIARFEAVRTGTLRFVERLEDSDLNRNGYHPYLGEGTLERFIRWAYEHTAIHEAEVREAIKAYHESDQ
jgi:hypothetical protein